MEQKAMTHEAKQCVDQMYEQIYEDAYDDGYQEGLNDAWECFKRIVYHSNNGGFTVAEMCEIFETSIPANIVRRFSPSEAIRKIKDYEQKKKQADAEISVGDEVIYKYAVEKEGQKGIVTALYYCDGRRSADIISTNGEVFGGILLEYLHKTSKHYDAFEEVLKELRGEVMRNDAN